MTIRLITIGIGHYPSEESWSSKLIDVSREEIEKIFQRHGAATCQWTGKKADLETEFERWSSRERADEDTSHVLYWTGHGEDVDSRFWLATSESKRPLPYNKAVSSVDLADYLTQEFRQRDALSSDAWTLFIIDACGSGPGIRRIRDGFTKEFPARNIALIGTTEDSSSAYSGEFPPVLGRVLETMDAEASDSISVKELVRRVGDNLGGLDQAWEAMQPYASLPKTGTAPPNVTAPIDIQQEIVRILNTHPDAALSHFFPKAQGAEINELAWFFRGRVAERRRINDWLENARAGLLVVTGVAGSGKSALLGMVLASTDPALMEALEREYDLGGSDLRPRDVRFDIVIHLSGQDVNDCIKTLANDLRLPEADTADEFIESVRSLSTDGSLTILADALDESLDPFTIATGVLGRLAKLPNVRILVGTRRSLGEDPDNPQTTRQNLLDPLNLPDDRIIELVSDPSAIARYVRDKLERASLPRAKAKEIERIAEVIGKSGRPFLFARLAVNEIISDQQWLHAPRDEFAKLLAKGHSGIFARAVARYRRTAPHLEALVHALAYAKGSGFPRNDGIWAIAGSALYGAQLNDVDISGALIEAAPYIMKDTEHQQTVYRLAHRTFIDNYPHEEPAP